MTTPSKTTLLGGLTILSGLLSSALHYLTTGQLDLSALGTALAAGVGLIHAEDGR